MKNSKKEFILDKIGYDYLTTDETLKAFNVIQKFRLHSSGCAVFQTSQKQKNGGSKMITHYLHKLIAEKFLSDSKIGKRKLVSTLNGNKLDCRIQNLVFRSREQTSRLKKTSAISGYTGVYQEGKRYRVIISNNGKSVHVGMFSSKIQAAIAYNEASKHLYGNQGKLNILPTDLQEEEHEFNLQEFKIILKKKS